MRPNEYLLPSLRSLTAAVERCFVLQALFHKLLQERRAIGFCPLENRLPPVFESINLRHCYPGIVCEKKNGIDVIRLSQLKTVPTPGEENSERRRGAEAVLYDVESGLREQLENGSSYISAEALCQQIEQIRERICEQISGGFMSSDGSEVVPAPRSLDDSDSSSSYAQHGDSDSSSNAHGARRFGESTGAVGVGGAPVEDEENITSAGTISPDATTSCTAENELPIDPYRADLLEYIDANTLSCVVSATGSGKSTRIPMFLYEQHWQRYYSNLLPSGERGIHSNRLPVDEFSVWIIVPRRQPAEQLARRVHSIAQKMLKVDLDIGEVVGYAIGGEQRWEVAFGWSWADLDF